MSDKKLKAYAITLIVKPKQIGVNRYSSKSFSGISFAYNPKDAKEQTIQQIIESFDPKTIPFIDREVVTIKKCQLYNDFLNKSK